MNGKFWGQVFVVVLVLVGLLWLCRGLSLAWQQSTPDEPGTQRPATGQMAAGDLPAPVPVVAVNEGR